MEDLVEKLKNKFSKKKVLITGAAGFKGAYLSFILKKIFDSDVFGIGNYNDHPKYVLWKNLSKTLDIEFIKSDLNESSKINGLLLKNNFDYIFHLAAKSIVSFCQKNPLDAWNSNVLSLGNFLDLVNKTQQNTIITVITTDKVYMNQEWDYNYRENDIIWRDDHYGASKVGAELITAAFAKTEMLKNNFGFNIVRAGNVIGPGDLNDNRFFTDLFTCMKNNQVMKIRDEKSTRPWQNVIDCLVSYLLVASNGSIGKYLEFNIGQRHNDNITVKKILDLVKSKHPEFKWKRIENNEIYEARLLSLDTAKFYSKFDFVPKLSVEQTLNETIEWYMKLAKGHWTPIETQIEDYFYVK